MSRKSRTRDVTRGYARSQFVAKLRRLADSIEAGDAFSIQIARERIHVPARAVFTVEHEKASGVEEIEFQVTWKPEPMR